MGIMRKILFATLCLALLAGPAVSSAVAEPSASVATAPARTVIVDFYHRLLTVMKDGPKLGFKGRYKMLEPAVDRAFAMESMAKLSLGVASTTLPAAEMTQFVKAFRDYTVANYAGNFTDYSGERFIVGEVSAIPGGAVVVSSKLVPAKGDPVSLDYVMHRVDGKWGITDVLAEGSISQVAMRRSEFVSVLQRQGFSTLLKVLAEKAQVLAGKD